MEIVELINVWMATLLPVATEMLKRFYPSLDSRVATLIAIAVFLLIFFGLGADAVEVFVSVVTSLAAYGLLLKPVVIEPLLGKRKKR
ncbi:MAG: hypothetical protein WD431_11885 [Cyclobacteriaceae bacterium]